MSFSEGEHRNIDAHMKVQMFYLSRLFDARENHMVANDVADILGRRAPMPVTIYEYTDPEDTATKTDISVSLLPYETDLRLEEYSNQIRRDASKKLQSLTIQASEALEVSKNGGINSASQTFHIDISPATEHKTPPTIAERKERIFLIFAQNQGITLENWEKKWGEYLAKLGGTNVSMKAIDDLFGKIHHALEGAHPFVSPPNYSGDYQPDQDSINTHPDDE